MAVRVRRARKKQKPTSPNQGKPTDCYDWDEDLESETDLMGEESVEQWCSDA